MIDPTQLRNLSPARKADLIYAQARAEVTSKLWQMALGDADGDPPRDANMPLAQGGGTYSLSALLSLMADPSVASSDQFDGKGAVGTVPFAALPTQPLGKPEIDTVSGGTTALGANSKYQPIVENAAQRVGLPSSALAAIVDAEAGKRSGGEWNPWSRNPRSSAAGLGQFLSGTWISEAERAGTWLNNLSRRQGWLDGNGRVQPGARHQLLSQRYDPQSSIEATADYARHNVEKLKRSGVSIGGSTNAISRVAYLAHHLGRGDAERFLGQGIPEGRARELLAAQIGADRAGDRINRAGSATVAHREWLNGYVARQIRPQRFEQNG
jgi:hypothetical protein